MIILIFVSMLIRYVYEDSDSLIVYNDSLTICGNHHYAIKVEIAHNGKLNVKPWSGIMDSTGWLHLDAPSIFIHDSSSINSTEAGYHGGTTNGHAQGYGPGGGGSGMSGGGGGAGYGGVGGMGGDVTPGDGGSTYGEVSDTLIEIGSGGGAGRLTFVDGPGGNGGGSVFLQGSKVIIDSSDVEANGQNGNDGALEAGGGGSGGGIMIWADSIVIHNAMIRACGGNGGNAEFGGGGGAGGGRIKFFYSSHIDTSEMVTFVQGGAAGSGTYGSPEPGMPGTIYIGPVVSIIETAQKSAIGLMFYPTIVRHSLKLIIQNPPIVVKVYDISGRVVKTVCLEKNVEPVSFSDLKQGIYFLKTNDERNPVGKIILLK